MGWQQKVRAAANHHDKRAVGLQGLCVFRYLLHPTAGRGVG